MNLSVNDIYATLGEAFFRNAETAVLAQMADVQPCVISTGEGTVLVQENVAIMKNHGIILFIDRPLDQILSDIKMERRPTLRGGTHEDVIEQYNARIGHYRYAADFRFDNSHGFQPGVSGLAGLVGTIMTLPGYAPEGGMA